MQDEPKRKPLRLPEFPYTQAAYYFVTVCCKGKAPLFGRIVGNGLSPRQEPPLCGGCAPKRACGRSDRSAAVCLSRCGEIADADLRALPQHFSGVQVLKYVIMPDHLHLILALDGQSASVPQILASYKSGVSRKYGRAVWQKSYYDHVIRGRKDFEEIWRYIDNNPQKRWLQQHGEA